MGLEKVLYVVMGQTHRCVNLLVFVLFKVGLCGWMWVATFALSVRSCTLKIFVMELKRHNRLINLFIYFYILCLHFLTFNSALVQLSDDGYAPLPCIHQEVPLSTGPPDEIFYVVLYQYTAKVICMIILKPTARKWTLSKMIEKEKKKIDNISSTVFKRYLPVIKMCFLYIDWSGRRWAICEPRRISSSAGPRTKWVVDGGEEWV